MGMVAPHCIDGCPPCAECCDCTPPNPRIRRLQRWAAWLTALTISWNCLEAVVALVSGYLAGSIALVGFGLDSVVEVASALIVLWWLARQRSGHPADEATERRAVRAIALTFFAIAGYVTYEAVSQLLGFEEAPTYSAVGLALVALSLVVMPLLAWAKRRVATGLGSVTLEADAAETQLCSYLSAAVLIGLIANRLWSWWWADPLAGLVVAGLALREGREAWTNGDLCTSESFTVLAAAPCLADCCPSCPVPA